MTKRQAKIMYGWFLWCALAGIILGLRCPLQVVVAVVAVAIPAGFVYQAWSGFDVAFLTALGGVVVLQISFMATTLASAMVKRGLIADTSASPARPKV